MKQRTKARLGEISGGIAWSSGIALTATAGWLIVRAADHPGVLTLTIAMLGVRFFGLLRPVLRYVERLLSHDAALGELADRRVAVYEALIPLVPGRLGKRGEVYAAVVDDVDTMIDRQLRVRVPLVSAVIAAVVATGMTAIVDVVAAVIVAAISVVGGALAFAIARLGADAAEHAAVQARTELTQTVVETADLARELLMWHHEEEVLRRIDAESRALAKVRAVSAWGVGIGKALVVAMLGGGVVGVTMLGRSDHHSAAAIALMALCVLSLSEAMLACADAGLIAARVHAAEQRLDGVTHQEPMVGDPITPHVAPEHLDIAMTQVRVVWDAEHAIDIAPLAVVAGEHVAVVGPSGSGKSTLAQLLVRFVDPSTGHVTLDGVDYRELDRDDIYARIGYIDDDPHVFASTLVENVRFARPGASDAEVEAALRDASLGELVEAFPAGLNTRLGEGFVELSGGERARIAVARSLLADQSVLVCDEVVAHLDAITADQVAREIFAVSTGGRARSVVWVSHTASGLDLVDRVVTMQTQK